MHDCCIYKHDLEILLRETLYWKMKSQDIREMNVKMGGLTGYKVAVQQKK